MARPTVSILIKALNEERDIAAAIESALAALGDRTGEVILADCASTDRTVEVASAYPITIVRLDRIDDRSCGTGGQLGYQYSRGDFVCLIDGDMRLRKEFLGSAIDYLELKPKVGGVGGMIVECETQNVEFTQRIARDDPSRRPGPVTHLDCGGIFRRSALESIGYFTDRNVHGGEEMDLGARLHAAGWMLARIDQPSIDHRGHSGSGFRLLLGRVRSRMAFGTGELVRAAFGRPHFWFVVRHDRSIVLNMLVYGWWLTMAAVMLLSPDWTTGATLTAAIAVLPVAAMSIRWRSFVSGLYSVAVWNVLALCFIPGLLRQRKPPAGWIASTVVKDTALAEMTSPRESTSRHHEFALAKPAVHEPERAE
jgi:glycosyltransferase involved in cell wall biosynthesis